MGISDEELARKTGAFKIRQATAVAELKTRLQGWIDQNGGAKHSEGGETFYDYDCEIFTALLETAIDRYVRLHGATDALDLIQRCFNRQAEAHKRSLQ